MRALTANGIMWIAMVVVGKHIGIANTNCFLGTKTLECTDGDENDEAC